MTLMSRLQIKRALEDAGYTQKRVAHELGVSPITIHNVIKGVCASHRIRCHIAKIIDKPVVKVFDIKPNPTRRGRTPLI